jgi:protein phosphatase
VIDFFKRLLSNIGTKGDSSKPRANDETQNLPTAMTKPKYRIASCQSPGQERSHNEDTLFTLNSLLCGVDSPLAFGIYLIADGMGGHQSGELASNLAAQAVSQHLIDRVHHAYLFERESLNQVDIQKWVKEAIAEAQTLILRRVPGGGTTLTLVMAVGDDLFSAHVGDSRLYLLGVDGKMTLKTRDHSLVKRLVDLGEINESEAGFHPHRNVLYRALGQSDPFEPDTDTFTLQPGERLLICTDGLWGVITDQEMAKIINSSKDLDQIADELVLEADHAGGPDNISVVLIEKLN